MTKGNIEFRIYSEAMDTSLIKIAFRQLDLSNIPLVEGSVAEFNPSEREISVICIRSLDEDIINSAFTSLTDERRIIIVTDSEDIILASTLARLGFREIFVFPYELQKFKNYLAEVIEQEIISAEKSAAGKRSADFESIIGTSPEFQGTLNLAQKVAKNADVSILILGETGTGKGLLARAIHENSEKAGSPFVDIICTAIPSTLLESELFGFEKGAFTDARERKLGLLELAEQGTVFLDEIGDLGLEIQAKLLKALDNKVIRRLGGVNDISINARIIAATNRNLEKLVEEKLFRDDLYHRLNVITIKIPPLRERGNDVILLAEHFLKESSQKFNKPNFKVTGELKDFFQSYPWPGNVRELKNAIERGVLLAENNILSVKDFFNVSKGKSQISSAKSTNILLDIDFKQNDLDSISKAYAQEVLKKMENNKSKTAQILGISRPKLDKLLQS